jgi:hemerythrin superfamily protein
VTKSILSHDHAEIDALLDDALKKLEAEDNAAFGALDLFWARLAMHIRAEHLHLFPAVLKVSKKESLSDVPLIVKCLRRDHDFFMHELGDIIKGMRAVTIENNSGLDTAQRLHGIRDRLVGHNAIEEQRIYPLRDQLSQQDEQDLSRSIAKELNNLPPRFSK